METDFQSLDSDEGVELSKDHEDLYTNNFPYIDETETVLEAKTLYLLLPKNVPVSRTERLQWFLDHLNTVIRVPLIEKWNDTSNEIEILAAIARDQSVTKCNRYLINSRTEIIFLAHSYRFVYCLDMSPSQSVVDVQINEILFDEILNSFKTTVEGLAKQFIIPGNSLIFQPKIFLTVMVNTPFFMSPAQQVLVKGVQISTNNLYDIIDFVQEQFHLLEGKIADVTAKVHAQNDSQRIQHEGIVGSLFDLPEPDKKPTKVPMVSPDANFVNMLRYSMLAISLLPENSISHILVITDGVVAMPDSNVMESLLFQLHYDSISVSFIKVGSTFHPNTSAGYVPFIDLLNFFANSTMGTCLENCPDIQHESSMLMNIYHELFLLWSFHNKCEYRRNYNRTKWRSSNVNFYIHQMPNLLSKRQTDESTSASILLLLSRRMREGFVIDNVNYINGIIDIQLSLQWKSSIYILYKVSSQWPIINKHNTRLEIYVSAPYEFLHDITCVIKKDNKSLYRQAIIERFWLRLSQLTSTDINFAQHLNVFQNTNVWYNLPESVRSGIPVFNLNSPSFECNKLLLSPSSTTCSKFINAWQALCQMDTGNWRKWFHTHKISLILKHDTPLPKYLHLPNSTQRFQVVQCRQAATALYGKLSEWASFVLIDNHTYLKLLYNESNKTPVWFCIVRITSKLPCAVLNIGYLTRTPGNIRYESYETLKRELSALSYMPSPGKTKENLCCVLLQKPLEKILIRYERIPNDFTTVIFPDGTQPPRTSLNNIPSPLTNTLFTTLSRYLYHKRWIWNATHSSNLRLEDNAISRILNTLTTMRLKEGFSFAYSSSGIITMVMELFMEYNISCIVQYVLFPPHRTCCKNNNINNCDNFSNSSDDDFDIEFDSELQLVTEVWIEPQYGRVKVNDNKRINYMNNKYYYEIADVIKHIDWQCINSLLTLEHLSLMCQEKSHSFSIDTTITFNRFNSTNIKTVTRKNSKNSLLEATKTPELEWKWCPITAPRIEHIPFIFNPINILPLCQQTELLFSMFVERKDKNSHEYDCDKSNKILLDNIEDHLHLLHDREITLTKDESDRFTKQILKRHKNPGNCPIINYKDNKQFQTSKWRCFIKGISITHVILTFIPATLDDLKDLVNSDNLNIPNINNSNESVDKISSKDSNYSDVPINTTNSLTLPIYVYDCPLAVLVGSYINNNDEPIINKDIYEDHRFKTFDSLQDDCLRLKYDDGNTSDNKNDDIEFNDNKTSAKHHCKTLVLVHSKCFTISLFVALHQKIHVQSVDVQAAMDQCEEIVTEIDITDYIMATCGHIKYNKDDRIDINSLRQPTPCNELKCLHALIKEKFFKMINVAFIPIPTNQEFYFCRYYSNSKLDKSQTAINNNGNNEDHNSDDDLSNALSDRDFSEYSENYKIPLQRLESTISDVVMNDINPLFLHLVCTMKYNNGELCYTSVRLLPTCLGELTDNKDISQFIEKKKLQITLDILCLTLPTDVQNVISEYSSQGLRTTSFCSDGFQTSISSTVSEISFTGEIPEPLISLPDYQRKSIILLCEEIRWLLKDEIVTASLDNDIITLNNLNFVMKHVAESKGRSSCILDVIDLNFVFGSNQSHHKFIEEFAKIHIPDYKLIREDDLYYIAKDINLDYKWNNYVDFRKMNDLDFYDGVSQSDTSSIEESVPGTDPTGYDEDVSNDEDDFEWLIHLNNKRQYLPNFWLILKVDPDTVTVYFHCRFLELDTSYVENYLQIQRLVSDEIRALCKRVNQSLLLQSLYETKTCDPLLEPDDSINEWRTNNSPSSISRNSSYSRLRSMNETSDETELMTSSVTLSELSMNFKPGYFRCPVVWQTHFVLHPRLKTGPGKSGISRGILALKNILDKFSVSNRTNMFVYRDNKSNVFYLRLYENVHNLSNKATQLRANEYENVVSRSPSIASLPSGQKSQLNHIEQCVNSSVMNDIRPRVRSFGEKESKDSPNEDTLILKVHGITEAGTDVQCDLVQVLQNRLDDAVLEFLSVMLARNSMCPLSPEDVHFIQKPFRLPEVVVKLTMQDFVYQYMDSFIYYLKQNLLQFLNIPKYTDNRSHYHFKDYSESDQTINRNTDDNIFLYNQSQNPSAGSRGIACIALAVVQNYDIPHIDDVKRKFDEIIENKTYTNILKSAILDDTINKLPPVHLEFRLWKQGRVNIDNLSIKLREAISQATWDIIMEYKILIPPLCESNNYNKLNIKPVNINDLNLNKEIEFNCLLDVVKRDNIKWQNKRKLEPFYLPRKHHRRLMNPPTLKATRSITFDDYEKDKDNYVNRQPNTKPTIKLNNYETGDDGILSINYSKYLPIWLEFGSILMTPSVRKQKILLTNNHITNTTIKELLTFIQETPKAFVSLPTEHINNENNEIFIPYDPKKYNQKCVIILRNFENWKASTLYNNSNEYSNLINSQNLKHTQKFVPTVLHNKFIPRQKILWILVQNDSMLIYTYNWARDTIDKLITNCTKLGQWLSVRSCFLNSVISQKLGLFHNQAITQKSFLTSNNCYTSVIGVTLSMMEFPRDDNRKTLINTSNLSSILEAFRDSFHPLKYAINDPVIVFTVEMTEMKSVEKTFRDDMKKLHSMYQSRTSTTTVSQIHLLMKNSRIVHYCHTPLLFLPTWRLKAASTRGPIDPTRCYNNKNNINYNLEKDSWHTELCYNFFCEYRRYLQTLGFMPLQIDNSNRKIGIWARDNSSLNSIFYIQKTIMGGILLFTVEFNEPFFTTILHAIECNRLQTTSRASINQFTLCFLDECDRVKLLMHLHSFTYDYHLRTIYNYISTPANKNCDRYNINQFFDDFMKYYNKAPNFARNLIHSDTITIKNMITEGKQLYDYLLTNIGQYNFNYKISDGEIDYILIKLSNNSNNSYKDSHDKEQQIDDFDITLLFYNICSTHPPADNVLHLKYYLILISKSEIYPKCEIEHHKLGKFRTVSSTARSLSTIDKNSSDIESSTTNSIEIEQNDITSSTDELPSNSLDKQQKEDKNQSDNSNQQQQQQHIEISSESVNYLGYFSPHEQTMQQIILDKAKILEKRIRETVNKGMVHCRTHLLWNQLVSQDSQTLTYDEFIELKNLAKLEHLCDIHPNLGPLLNQPISWYQGLAKLLLTKYSDQNRSFISSDGNIIHYVILHPRYSGAFMLLSLDLHMSRGDLYAVYREPQENEELSLAYRKALLDGFVNCVCFYLWQGMI